MRGEGWGKGLVGLDGAWLLGEVAKHFWAANQGTRELGRTGLRTRRSAADLRAAGSCFRQATGCPWTSSEQEAKGGEVGIAFSVLLFRFSSSISSHFFFSRSSDFDELSCFLGRRKQPPTAPPHESDQQSLALALDLLWSSPNRIKLARCFGGLGGRGRAAHSERTQKGVRTSKNQLLASCVCFFFKPRERQTTRGVFLEGADKTSSGPHVFFFRFFFERGETRTARQQLRPAAAPRASLGRI